MAAAYKSKSAKTAKTTLGQLTWWLEANGGKRADDDHFAKAMPDYYATLTQPD